MTNALDTFLGWIEKRGGKRSIYRIPDNRTEPELYLERFYLVKCRWFEAMVHRFHQSDLGDIHDHPWNSCGWILREGYLEHVLDKSTNMVGIFKRRPGNFSNRKATDFHRVELRPGTAGKVYTLFLTGIRKRNWGFLTNKGWVDWETYSAQDGNLDCNYIPPYVGVIFPRVK